MPHVSRTQLANNYQRVVLSHPRTHPACLSGWLSLCTPNRFMKGFKQGAPDAEADSRAVQVCTCVFVCLGKARHNNSTEAFFVRHLLVFLLVLLCA